MLGVDRRACSKQEHFKMLYRSITEIARELGEDRGFEYQLSVVHTDEHDWAVILHWFIEASLPRDWIRC